MDTNQNPSKKKKTKLKRPHAEADSDSDSDQTLFPKFIMLESMEDTPITKLSPFIIEKTLNSFIKAKFVKKLITNTLLIEVEINPFSDLLLKQKYFYNLKIKVYSHNTLNSSKGVVRSPELSLCTLNEIKNNLRKQGVTDAKQISIKRSNQIIPTNTYILNFNTPKPPTEIKIGYLITKVETYIPNPLRCHNCQKFGHHKEKYTKPPICKNGREIGNYIDC